MGDDALTSGPTGSELLHSTVTARATAQHVPHYELAGLPSGVLSPHCSALASARLRRPYVIQRHKADSLPVNPATNRRETSQTSSVIPHFLRKPISPCPLSSSPSPFFLPFPVLPTLTDPTSDFPVIPTSRPDLSWPWPALPLYCTYSLVCRAAVSGRPGGGRRRRTAGRPGVVRRLPGGSRAGRWRGGGEPGPAQQHIRVTLAGRCAISRPARTAVT